MKNKLKNILKNQFWPFMEFKNCYTEKDKIKSYQYNQEHVFLLEIPILNWIIIELFTIINLILVEKIPSTYIWHILGSAFLGIMFSLIFILLIILLICYSYLMYVDINYNN